MSWNAAKRALSYGYTNVYWFYNGIDDWFFENYDFEVLTPAQGQRQVEIPDE
jgi:rhodanese-related sulfurtransferase